MKSSFRIPCAAFRPLSAILVLGTFALPGTTSADFAEFPQSEAILTSEIEYRASELASCRPKARCIFLKAYSGYLRERVRTLTESADPLGYLSKYPEETETHVRDYQDSIEYEFDVRFTEGFAEWRQKNASGADRSPYEDYAVYDALPKLLREYRSARAPVDRAALEVGIRYLLSDATLLSRQCAE